MSYIQLIVNLIFVISIVPIRSGLQAFRRIRLAKLLMVKNDSGEKLLYSLVVLSYIWWALVDLTVKLTFDSLLVQGLFAFEMTVKTSTNKDEHCWKTIDDNLMTPLFLICNM